MNSNGAREWGHASRYYASAVAPPVTISGRPRTAQYAWAERPLTPTAEDRWAALLEKAAPGARQTVERAFKQWNNIIRDHLRSETALRLTVGDDAQAVPVRVVGGMPAPFAEVMREFEGGEWLLLNRPLLIAAVNGTVFVESNYGAAADLLGGLPPLPSCEDVGRVRGMAEQLLKKLDDAKVVERIIGIEEDVLGAYFFRVPEIRLYWMVIGIVSAALGVSVEALTVVVLAHELAHAYTHLGRDIDSERWETEDFARADPSIVEGLAQFYTKVICERLEARAPAAAEAYKTLLAKQSGPYRAHVEWVDESERGGEIVRVAMIECRSQGIRDSERFSAAIDRHRKQVKGREKPRKPGDGSADALFSPAGGD